MNKIWNGIKRGFLETGYFITSKLFLKNFFGMALTISAFVGSAFLFIHLFSRHGDYIEMPNLDGLSLPEASAKYRNISFHVDSINKVDSLTGERAPLLSIQSQDPPANTKIKKGRRVYITVQQINPDLATMPNIWGRQADRVINSLQNRKLKGKILRTEPDRAENTVLKALLFHPNGDSTILHPYTNVKDAQRIPEGTMIYLVVAQGMGEQVLLPNFKCQTYDAALFTLDGYQLRLGSVFADANVIDSAAAFVYRQNPIFIDTRKIQKGQEIDLWLTRDAPIGCEIDSDFIIEEDTSTSTINR